MTNLPVTLPLDAFLTFQFAFPVWVSAGICSSSVRRGICYCLRNANAKPAMKTHLIPAQKLIHKSVWRQECPTLPSLR